MNILVLGSGGREHALAAAFQRQGHRVFIFPGNPGMNELGTTLTGSSLDDLESLSELARVNQITLTVVGPEGPLEKGIADFFAARKQLVFGPTKQAARLETSKAFAKAFMARHGIPTARFFTASSLPAAKSAAERLFEQGLGVVVKPSGLTGGKGVTCCHTLEEAGEVLDALMEKKIYGSAGEDVVLEELLQGPEISFQMLSDGSSLTPLLPAQDHKRAFEGNLGPNTGGMGAIAPLDLVTSELQSRIEREIAEPTLRGLQKEGIDYRGLLYIGLMLTKEGPKVLEYNCRFGDPETQALLPLLESDLGEILLQCAQGTLTTPLEWKNAYSCCVVLASKGYPGEISLLAPIEHLPSLKEGLFLFHAGTTFQDNQLKTAGGRVLSLTGLGPTLAQAISHTYQALEKNSFPWAHFRTDIGT